MEKRLQVRWLDGSMVGHLIHRGAVYFVYDRAWLGEGGSPSPISQPFTDSAFNGSNPKLLRVILPITSSAWYKSGDGRGTPLECHPR